MAVLGRQAQYEATIDALRQPRAYVAEGLSPRQIDVAETHVSHLFFTGTLVYKVKKPVDLGFVDATTLERRRLLCEREVEVNRRFSPRVYIGVVPITMGPDGPMVGGDGEVIDYAVKMRRLPADRMLNALLEQDAVTASQIRRVAVRIAGMHREAPTSAEIARLGGVDALQDHVGENFAGTRRYIGEIVDRAAYEDIVAYSNAFLHAYEPLLRERGQRGFVRDGHGDLHAGQICMAGGIEFIDAIEFDPTYRYGDVGLDAAFLAMDLDRYGREALSAAFMETYMQATGDDRLQDLIGFFKCYRAFVRAKVASLRSENAGLRPAERVAVLQEARTYYALARRYALEALPHPALYLVTGLSGTGKSTVARGLAERWAMPVFSSDAERKRMAGIAPSEHRHAAYGEGIYAPANDEAVYRALVDLAARKLAAGESVVLDATFRRAAFRKAAVDAAAAAGAGVWVVECVTPSAVVESRLRIRESVGKDLSDAGTEVYRRQRQEWEPVEEAGAARHIRVRTTAPPEEVLERVVSQVFEKSVLPKEVVQCSSGFSFL